MAHLHYPYHLDTRGRTAETGAADYVRDLIEQVLFTAPGERVNRPDFGCGLAQMVFAANSAEIAATTQFLVQGALQQWLGDVIEVEAVDVAAEEATLTVRLRYRLRRSGERIEATFSQAGGTTP
ncbi:MAG: GPW/gp25 family protein [Opitutales bacterium]